jgi:hypothetical protein
MVRDANPSDFPVIRALHSEAGWDFGIPDLSSPLILINKVVEGPEGVIGSCFCRLTAETFLLLDPNLDPRRKVVAMQELQPAVFSTAWALGLDELNARISPETTRRFSKRLKQLGWQEARSGWSAWSRVCNERF